jgi:hypothetical protein
MLICGGSGSGKTHLMRYFSYPQQKRRHKENIREGLKNDGYVGCYLNCRELNTGRFKGRGYSTGAWDILFAYYFELWLAQRVLHTFGDVFRDSVAFQQVEKDVCREIFALLDENHGNPPAGLYEMAAFLRGRQQEIDHAVNGCAMARSPEQFTAKAARGALPFKIPEIICRNHSAIRKCTVVYLVDDFEILTESQQRFLLSLIREKKLPCSFKIAVCSRSLQGENKKGIQFEYLNLDDIFGENKNYEIWARRLVIRRLKAHGLFRDNALDAESLAEFSRYFLADEEKRRFEQSATSFVQVHCNNDRPYFKTLREKLALAVDNNAAPGLPNAADIPRLLALLSCPQYPLLEKTNIYLLYKAWRAGEKLMNAATRIAADCKMAVDREKNSTSYTRVLGHFKADLLAQLRKDCGLQQSYAGFKILTDMSMGCPRNLLLLLQNIFSWAAFNAEHIFDSGPISMQSQYQGVLDAGEWFFFGAQKMGEDARHVRESLERLGVLMQRIRFSDKPSECSLTTFSFDDTKISAQSKRIIDLAKKELFLVDVGSQKDRNTGAPHAKIQIHRMLAPRWDLPIYRRGAIALQPEEVNAIFDARDKADFEVVLENRLTRMEAPYFGRQEDVALPFFRQQRDDHTHDHP